MTNWKRPLFIGIGWGLGTAVGLILLIAGALWYEDRPKPPTPPKPWDSTSIKVDYDIVETENDKNTIVFYYTLENTTAFDYRIEDDHNVLFAGKLEKKNSLAPFGDNGTIEYPIFVPAKKRVRVRIHFAYPYPTKERENANAEERKKYREAVEEYLAANLPNLDGFDLLDETNRYELVFPAGWKRSKSK